MTRNDRAQHRRFLLSLETGFLNPIRLAADVDDFLAGNRSLAHALLWFSYVINDRFIE